MKKQLSTEEILLFPRELLGKWRADFEDGRSEYEIRLSGDQLIVNGRDFIDGEKYKISNLSFDSLSVEFDTLMKSTGRSGHLVIIKDKYSGSAEIQFTFTYFYRAIRVDE